MQIPSDWSGSKRPRGERLRVDAGRKKAKAATAVEGAMPAQDLCRSICRSILESKTGQLDPVDFTTVLSAVSYKAILGSLFRDCYVPVVDVPVITKTFEEAYMREPIGSERKCVMGLECECLFIDKELSFVGVEFLLPSQTVVNCDQQMCVLCSRKHTQKLFYDMLYGQHRQHYGVIQRYGVVGGVPLEYSTDSLLVMPPSLHVQCMPYPTVAHVRSNYKVQVRNSTRYMVQKASLGFQMPPHAKSSYP
jgi:hypothetical protein